MGQIVTDPPKLLKFQLKNIKSKIFGENFIFLRSNLVDVFLIFLHIIYLNANFWLKNLIHHLWLSQRPLCNFFKKWVIHGLFYHLFSNKRYNFYN